MRNEIIPDLEVSPQVCFASPPKFFDNVYFEIYSKTIYIFHAFLFCNRSCSSKMMKRNKHKMSYDKK